VRPPVVPEDISGRGITVVNKEVVEFQTAIALDGDNEAERITAISQSYGELAANWHGYMPIQLDGSTDGSDDSYDATSYYSPVTRSNPPESISDDSRNLVLGTSKSGALMYGLSLSEDYKVCACADEVNKLGDFYRATLSNMAQYRDRQIVFIDDNEGTHKSIVDVCPNCRYINKVSELDLFIDELKPQLNSRLENPNGQHEQLFIIISEFNTFFDMITNEQAAFMRKVFQYIDSPKYRIYFVCGFNVNGDKNNDSLFMSLVVNAENYVLCPNSYELASTKIETLPLITDVKSHGCYFCLKEKNIEIRW